MPDLPLIEASKAGDQHAFLRLLGKYDQQIMSVVYRFTGNCYDREDLYQEIFLNVYQSLGGFRGEAAFATWLYRIALNRCIHYMKKKPTLAEAEDQPGEPQDMERRARVNAIMKAVKRLKGNQRICFHLHYVEGWDISRIAQTLAISEGTVKSHLDRARTKVKQDKEVLPWKTGLN